MRIVALLSWYDEPPELLSSNVASWSKLCDRVIALDGAYADLPDGKPHSPIEQRAAIEWAAQHTGMGVTMIGPGVTWVGNQIAKRNALLTHAARITSSTDWLLTIDADEYLEPPPLGVRERLMDTERDVARVKIRADAILYQQRLVRALPGLRVEGVHWRVMNFERCLWGIPGKDHEEPFLDLPDVVIRHRRDERPAKRLAQQKAYYDLVPEPGYIA